MRRIGAHFGFHPYFSENANQKGADLVIHSLHKTLPALTQTALLHMNGERADRRRVRKYLHMLQTSSPSYVLMASADACIHLLREEPEQVFEPYVRCLKETREKLCSLKNLRLAKVEGMDPSKLVISVKDAGISSRELYDRLLQDWHLQPEMRGRYLCAFDDHTGRYPGRNGTAGPSALRDRRRGGRRERRGAKAGRSRPFH